MIDLKPLIPLMRDSDGAGTGQLYLRNERHATGRIMVCVYSGFESYGEGHVTATPKRPNRFDPMLFRLLFSQRWGYAMVCK